MSGLAGGFLPEGFGDADGAPFFAAHGAVVDVSGVADVVHFLAVSGSMASARCFSQSRFARALGEFVVPVAGAGQAAGDVGGVGGDP